MMILLIFTAVMLFQSYKITELQTKVSKLSHELDYLTNIVKNLDK